MIKNLILATLLISIITYGNHAITSEEELNAGPGVFTKEAGEFKFPFEKKKDDSHKTTKKESHKQIKATKAEPTNQKKTKDSLLSSQSDFDEFKLYKEWRTAKQLNNDDYQEFQEWMNYLRFKSNKQ